MIRRDRYPLSLGILFCRPQVGIENLTLETAQFPPWTAAPMGLVQNIVKRIPSSPNLPSLEKLPTLGDLSRQKERITPRLAFFRRRIRLKGNSKISVPLGTVLLFPCIVIIIILVLVARHPTNPVRRLLPAGSPPSIRYALLAISYRSARKLNLIPHLGELARNMTKSL